MDEAAKDETNRDTPQQQALNTIKEKVENDWRAGELPGQIANAMGGDDEDWELLRKAEDQIDKPDFWDLVNKINERINLNIDKHLEGGRVSLTEPYEHDFWPKGVPNPEPQFYEKPLKICANFKIEREKQILGEYEVFLNGWEQMLTQINPDKFDRLVVDESSLLRRYYDSLEGYIKWSLKFGQISDSLGDEAVDLFEFRRKYPNPKNEKLRLSEKEGLKQMAEKLENIGISSVYDNEEIMEWLTSED